MLMGSLLDARKPTDEEVPGPILASRFESLWHLLTLAPG